MTALAQAELAELARELELGPPRQQDLDLRQVERQQLAARY